MKFAMERQSRFDVPTFFLSLHQREAKIKKTGSSEPVSKKL
jgi:hypothetical protein